MDINTMNKAFEESSDIKVTAAQIGISRDKWHFSDEKWSESQAREFMKKNSYDILPIKSSNGEYEYFWSTRVSGQFDTISKQKIEGSNTLYYLTQLKDLLVKFQDSENSSYFLSDHSTINGLVSNVNLNSKPVYVYFYSLISKMEIELGHWLKALISEDEMIAQIEEKAQNPADELSPETLKRFKVDLKKNHDNHFVEYLYLSQIQYLIRKRRLVSSLGYHSNKEFGADFKIISQYRNWFAHPLNSPRSNLSQDLQNLHQALERLSYNINSISLNLPRSYYDATYKTLETPKFSIKIGESNTELIDYLKENKFKNWAFITAENPSSTKLSREENTERNSWLESRLRKEKYAFLKGVGLPKDGDWEAENSYLIFNIGLKRANKISEVFRQNAFVYGELDGIPELKRVF